MSEKPKVLCVDDEPMVLEGLKLRLRKQYDVRIADGGEKGLEVIKEAGPFAVIVSDMRMPEMDGAEFLSRARNVSPDSVRMLLTGYSEVESAIDAVNRGQIFRFLTKPCEKDVFQSAITDAVKQYQLQRAEKDVLEQTLKGAVQVLTDVLSLVNPAAFSRGNRVRRLIRRFASEFPELDAWELEVAAMLSQVGLVTIPSEVVEKSIAGETLTTSQKQMLKAQASIGRDLIAQIPRLENVAELVGHHETSFAHGGADAPLGSRILKVVIDFDNLTSGGASPDEAVRELQSRSDDYDLAVVAKLKKAAGRLESKMTVQELPAKSLRVGMMLHAAAKTKHGTTLIGDGNEITAALLARLRNFAEFDNLQEPLKVLAPVDD